MRRPATMGDVATLAGIEQLGDQRNVAARTLVTPRSQTFGLVALATRLYGPTSVVSGIEQAARDAGYSVSIASPTSVDGVPLAAALNRLVEHGVEGVVVVAPEAPAQAAVADLAATLPVVVVDGHAGNVPRVLVDHGEGARLATAHLLDQGVRTVHHVAGPAGRFETDERVRGWQRALAAAGATPPEPLSGNWSCGSGYDAGRALAADPDVEAVFVANDRMAFGLLRAFAEAGRPAPDGVLVAGFDDVPEAAYVRPPLTTVRQDFAALGRRSIDVLVAQLEGQDVPRTQVVPADLIVRSSSVPSPMKGSRRSR